MVENIKFFIRNAKLIDMIPKHIFWPIINCFSMYVTGVTAVMHSRCCFTPIVAESVGVVTSDHVTKMAVTSFDPPFLKTPCYMQTSRLCLL